MSNWIFGARRSRSDASLSELREKYSFLKLPNLMLDEEAERQQYESAYELYVFMRSFIVTCLAVGIIAAALLIYYNFIPEKLQKFGANELIINLWPWNKSLIEQINSYQSRLYRTLEEIQKFYLLNSLTSTVFMLWLFYRILEEIFRRDCFDFRAGRLSILCISISIFSWLNVGSKLANYFSMTAPSLLDNEYVLIAKYLIGIGLTYFITGASVFAIGSFLRLKFIRAKQIIVR